VGEIIMPIYMLKELYINILKEKYFPVLLSQHNSWYLSYSLGKNKVYINIPWYVGNI